MGTLMLLVIPFIHLHEGNLLGKYSHKSKKKNLISISILGELYMLDEITMKSLHKITQKSYQVTCWLDLPLYPLFTPNMSMIISNDNPPRL